MTRQKKLLFLCHTLPYPPFQGVEIRALNVLRLLSRYYRVDLLCFHRLTDRAELRLSLATLSSIADVRAFRIGQSRSRIRFLWDHLRSILLRRPYTRFVYESRDFHAALAASLSANNYALVHVDSVSDLAAYLPMLRALPVAGTHHNVESVLLDRRAAVEGGWFRRKYMRFQARLMAAEERTACESIALNIAVSTPDRERFIEIAPKARFVVASNGVDVDFFRPAEPAESGIVFVGGATWFPNRDALDYFAVEILPRIRAEVGPVPVRWVGSADERTRRRFMEEHGIELTGRVEDIRPHVTTSACFVVPLRVGGGTRLKILDAWAMGMAVVSTSIGCEGLEASHGDNILVADSPAEFAASVSSILSNRDLRGRLGRSGRSTVERLYSWDRIGDTLVPTYEGLYRGSPEMIGEESGAS